MKYLSKSTVLESWKKIVEQGISNSASLNKFFGFLEILRHLNLDSDERIESNCQYSISSSQLSLSLQDKYFFDQKNIKTFPSQEIINVILPNFWAENIFQLILKSDKLPLENVAFVCLQNEEFEDDHSEQNIIDIFLDKYHLKNFEEFFFIREGGKVEFSSTPFDRRGLFIKLKQHFDIKDNSKFTLGFDKKVISANPGELARGPFIQPLYSGQDNLKFLLFATFDITNYYEISKTTNLSSDSKFSNNESHQIIFFGSPGAGKSRAVNMRTMKHNRIRTTFHPETDYHSFVGSYKPIMDGETIKYKFVPQAFTKAYCEAWLNPEQPFYLIIEEINRGNCAQIFGDIFQCLDRNENGFSEYGIDCDKDLANYIKSVFEASENTDVVDNYKKYIKTENFDKIVLPNNLYILATMNTSDQSLFPMDSAFKRRWDWEYIPIDYVDAATLKIEIGGSVFNWGKFIQNINPKIKELTGSEDKQLGNRFVNPKNGIITFDQFRSKVMFYLWSEVYKDEFGTQNSIFKYQLEEGTPNDFLFGDLYEGNATEIVLSFMRFNGIEPEE